MGIIVSIMQTVKANTKTRLTNLYFINILLADQNLHRKHHAETKIIIHNKYITNPIMIQVFSLYFSRIFESFWRVRITCVEKRKTRYKKADKRCCFNKGYISIYMQNASPKTTKKAAQILCLSCFCFVLFACVFLCVFRNTHRE